MNLIFYLQYSLAPSLCSSTRKKTSGTKIRRTPDVKLRFVSFIRFVNFNFSQVQLLRLVVVMVQSNSFVLVNNPYFTEAA